MTYKALYAGDGPDTSPLKAVARIDGNKVDVIFIETDLFDGEPVCYWSMPFNLTIEEPVQWEEFGYATENLWLELFEKLNDYNLTLLPE